MTPDPDAEIPPPRGRLHRTWPQQLVLTFNIVLVVACLVAAAAVFIGQKNLEDVLRVPADPTPDQLTPLPDLVIESLTGGTSTTTLAAITASTSTSPSTTAPGLEGVVIPPGSVKAENFLMTGSDSRACIDPDSPFAGAFLANGTEIGSRPDTIMILRLEPDTGRAAILSFPRDLWVPLAGTNRKAKINTAFDKSDPTRLIATLETYFQIPVDHYVNIDFCVFKDLVDAVGGVAVPFATPVRDKNTGLVVEKPGCFTFSGDHGLAYVRSRKIQYQDAKGVWHSEGTADIGRIRRQQDFLRRVMQKARSKGVLDLVFVKELVDTFQKRVEVDLDLTADDVLRLANAMSDFDPVTTRSFIIEGKFGYKGNLAVVEPLLDGERMQAILGIFRGQARISDAPAEQQDPITSDPTTSSTVPSPSTTVATTGFEVVDNADVAYGGANAVVPDKTAIC